MAYNTAVHETTGYTPFELTFGKEANLPSMLATTPSLTRQELVDIWKRRHDKYIERARVTRPDDDLLPPGLVTHICRG